MFAFVVWDERRRRALIARDHIGIKPLYFAEVGDVLLFGSELKTLLASGSCRPRSTSSPSICCSRSASFQAHGRFSATSRSSCQGIGSSSSRPTSGSSGTGSTPSRHRTPAVPDAEWEAQLLELLDDAVALQLMSDVPLGAMLSGGIDSSLITALMARRMNRPVQTFSVGFAGMPDNELATARTTAKALGADHHELELSLDDTVDLESLTWTMDEPVADLSAIGFMALSGLTAEHVTVALSGQGADELLAGYDRYRRTAAIDRWTAIPAPLRRAGAAAARRGSVRLRLAAAVAGARDPVTAAVGPLGMGDRRPRRGRRRSRRRSAVGARAGDSQTGSAAPAPEGRPRAPPRWAAQPRGRHAALLRPDIDGALHRGARPVSRPSHRRVLCADAGPPEAGRRRDEADPAHSRPRARAGRDHRQTESRLLQ